MGIFFRKCDIIIWVSFFLTIDDVPLVNSIHGDHDIGAVGKGSRGNESLDSEVFKGLVHFQDIRCVEVVF